jgi:hypothetical protein
MVLPARRRPHAHQLRHGGDHGGPACPAEQEAVDEARGSAVEKPEDEDAEESFPCYCRRAGEAENGDGGEVALEWGVSIACVYVCIDCLMGTT